MRNRQKRLSSDPVAELRGTRRTFLVSDLVEEFVRLLDCIGGCLRPTALSVLVTDSAPCYVSYSGRSLEKRMGDRNMPKR